MKQTVLLKGKHLLPLSLGLLLLAIGAFLTVIFLIPAASGIDIRMWCLLFCAVVLVLVLFILLRTRKEFVVYSDQLCACIDTLTEGGDSASFELYAETLSSKVQGRLMQLERITRAAANQSAEQKLEIQRMVSDISHQLKTPIANITMYNDTLLSRSVPPEQQTQFLETMQGQVEKLDFLIQALMKMSRLENNMIALRKENLPLFDTLASALSGILPKAEEKHLSLEISCDENACVLHDPKWTAEALENILDNAVKYTPENGTISISMQVLEVYTRLDIADTGIGVSPAHINDLFKRFYRDPQVHSIPGIGVGLYLTRKIITQQDGYIKVTPRSQGGTVFSIYLPKHLTD